jgi:hypothetical protein
MAETFMDMEWNNPPTQEPFVAADEAARFLGITRRFLLALARKGMAGAYPLGTGQERKIWVFRLSELGNAIAGRKLQ